MKTYRVLPRTFILASSVTCACIAQSVQLPLKLEVIEGLPIIGGVFLNGQGPFRFLLDTGEQSNEMAPSLVLQLHLAPTSRRELETPAGVSTVPGLHIREVALGTGLSIDTLHATNQEFLITRREGLRRLAPGILGTLGQQFLAHFDYILDLRHHVFQISGPPPYGVHIPFRLAFGCMVISTNQGELMLDSGANTLFLFRASPHLETANITTSNANMAVAIDRAPSLRIGNRRYDPPSAVFHPVTNAPVDGLLPASLFHSIFVSNSERYVVFDPK
jgi:hypothetical protein